MMDAKFQRACRRRAEAYGRQFGFRPSVIDSIDDLATFAASCQPTAIAALAVYDGEREWAADWLLDPRPEPPPPVTPTFVHCVRGRGLADEGFFFPPRSGPVGGWPLAWFVGSRAPSSVCRAWACTRREKLYGYCYQHAEARRRAFVDVSGLDHHRLPDTVIVRVLDTFLSRGRCTPRDVYAAARGTLDLGSCEILLQIIREHAA